jgi:hypothetical protein
VKALFTGGTLDGRELDESTWGLRYVVPVTGATETYIRDRYHYKYNQNGTVKRIAFRLEKTEVTPR